MTDDQLITLDEAAALPQLGGHIGPRALYRAASSQRLRTTRPTGRRLYTTPSWIRDWVQGSPSATPPGGGGSRDPSPKASAATASVAARIASLRSRRSQETSRG